jgi:hypothetical protein
MKVIFILTFISPILTYGGQGTKKSGVKPEHHAIIYTGDKPPTELPGEKRLSNRPIRVVGDTPRDKLFKESRVNYSKVYTIEHDVKVCSVGKIHSDDRAQFFLDFENSWAD